jgi:hypothetical protein
MFMISRETVAAVTSLKAKVADPAQKAQCIADLENMIRMKESHLARAEWGSCCGNIHNLAPQIEAELKMLRSTLDALMTSDLAKAGSLFEGYVISLQTNYTPEPDHW